MIITYLHLNLIILSIIQLKYTYVIILFNRFKITNDRLTSKEYYYYCEYYSKSHADVHTFFGWRDNQVITSGRINVFQIDVMKAKGIGRMFLMGRTKKQRVNG